MNSKQQQWKVRLISRLERGGQWTNARRGWGKPHRAPSKSLNPGWLRLSVTAQALLLLLPSLHLIFLSSSSSFVESALLLGERGVDPPPKKTNFPAQLLPSASLVSKPLTSPEEKTPECVIIRGECEKGPFPAVPDSPTPTRNCKNKKCNLVVVVQEAQRPVRCCSGCVEQKGESQIPSRASRVNGRRSERREKAKLSLFLKLHTHSQSLAQPTPQKKQAQDCRQGRKMLGDSNT